jgi:hypothetical protein
MKKFVILERAQNSTELEKALRFWHEIIYTRNFYLIQRYLHLDIHSNRNN